MLGLSFLAFYCLRMCLRRNDAVYHLFLFFLFLSVFSSFFFLPRDLFFFLTAAFISVFNINLGHVIKGFLRVSRRCFVFCWEVNGLFGLDARGGNG